MNDPEIFERLCSSALEFLRRSATEIEASPKFALIHFCTGLELVLKARLLHDHWSLVVTSKLDLKSFQAGNSESVGLSAAIDRIEKTLGENLQPKAKEAFQRVGQHRNRVVHFFHDLEDPKKKGLQQAVAADICLGWFFLGELLDRWSSEFRNHKKAIVLLHFEMKRVRTYLKVVFQQKRVEIETHRKKGATIQICPGCGFEAGVLREQVPNLLYQSCAVCNLGVHFVEFDCANYDCCKVHRLSGYDCFQPVQCECGQLNTQDDLRDYLDEDAPEDHLIEGSKNCGECQTPDSVVRHGDHFVCLECLFFSNGIGTCEWCHGHQLGGGSLEHSGLGGCEFCEGKAGWLSDD